MSNEFVRTLVLLVGGAFVAYLIIAGLVYAGSTRRSKRYRPGRPFEFRPVWFLSAPEKQARAGVVPGRELTSVAKPVRVGPVQTGGCGDRW